MSLIECCHSSVTFSFRSVAFLSRVDVNRRQYVNCNTVA